MVYSWRERAGRLEGSGCVDSGKEVTEANGEASAAVCCSSGCKSRGTLRVRRKEGKK